METVEDKLEEALNALEFYAAMENHPRDIAILTVIDGDKGKQAQTILDKCKEKHK